MELKLFLKTSYHSSSHANQGLKKQEFNAKGMILLSQIVD